MYHQMDTEYLNKQKISDQYYFFNWACIFSSCWYYYYYFSLNRIIKTVILEHIKYYPNEPNIIKFINYCIILLFFIYITRIINCLFFSTAPNFGIDW